MTKYLLLCSSAGLYCNAYDTYEEAYKTMETEFEIAKEGIQEEYGLCPIWFINECFANGAVLETLDEKYMVKWKIVKLTEEGQIAELPLFNKEEINEHKRFQSR